MSDELIERERPAFEAWAKPRWRNPSDWERAIRAPDWYNNYKLNAEFRGWMEGRRATSGAASGEVQELPKACSVAADHRLMELVNAMASATTDAAYRDAHQLLVRHLDSHNARHHQIVQTLMRLNEKLAEMAASAPAPHKPAGYMTPGSSQVDPSMALPPVPPTKTK